MKGLRAVLLFAGAAACAAHHDVGDAGGAADAGPAFPMVGAGTLAVVAAWQDFPSVAVVQGDVVYWSNSDDPGALLSAPIGGGTITTLAAGRHYPYSVVVDATNVYWTDYGTYDASDNYNNDGAVLQMPLAGGAITTLAAVQPAPNDLVVANGNVYWVNGGIGNSTGAVIEEPIGGGTPTTLFGAQATPNTVAVDANNIYWGNGGTFQSATGPYNNDGAILQAALGSTIMTTLASNQSYPYALVSDAHSVYVANQGSFDSSGNLLTQTGVIVSVPIGGGAVTTLATAQDNPLDIAVGSSELYWVNGGVASSTGAAQIGSVAELMLAAADGTPVTLVTDALAPVGVALSASGSSVYFTDSGTDGHDGVVFALVPSP